MKMFIPIAALLLSCLLPGPACAHRLEGLLQATLVEVLPSEIGIEVTLSPGIDIAPKLIAMLDTDGDGRFSAIESAVWAETFMAGQSVRVDSRALTLWVQSVRTSPFAEMTNGHGEIVVSFKADLGAIGSGPHRIECSNRYEPIPSTYQCNGLVPKAPGVQISSHARDERQRELLLKAEFSAARPTQLSSAFRRPAEARPPGDSLNSPQGYNAITARRGDGFAIRAEGGVPDSPSARQGKGE